MSQAIQLTAVVWREGDWYVSECIELGVASQGSTERLALRNLKEAVHLYLEDEEGKVRWPVDLKRKIVPISLSA